MSLPIEIITTDIEDLVIHRNRMFVDDRGALFQLAPNIDTNPHFPDGVKNLIAVNVFDKKPRGGHYHKVGADDVFTLKGLALWHFVDFRDEHVPRKTFSCIVGFGEKVTPGFFSDIPTFYAEQEGGHAHIHCPPGVYHTVWSIGKESLIFVEGKTTEYNEEYYVRMPMQDIPELCDFISKHPSLNF